MTDEVRVYNNVPDGGWGWLVCFSSFILQALTVGITYTFGITYIELLDYFRENRSTTAWIGSIQPALLYFTGIIGGPLLRRYGWRVTCISGAVLSAVGFAASAAAPNLYMLYFTYGALTGIGYGFIYMTSMVVVQHYFNKRRAMASGLAAAGSGMGTLTFGFAIPVALKKFGWRWTLVGEAAITLVTGVLFGSLYLPLQNIEDIGEHEVLINCEKPAKYGSNTDHETIAEEDSITSNQSKQNIEQVKKDSEPAMDNYFSTIHNIFRETFDFSILKVKSYTLFVVAFVLFTFGYHVPYTYTPDRAVAGLHVQTDDAAFLLSIMGISNVASRLLFGWLGDKNMTVRHFLTASVLLLGGVASAAMFLWSTYELMIVYSVLFGAFTGCFASLFPVVFVDLAGIDRIEKALGLGLGLGSVGFLFASPMSGWIIDLTQSFDAPFYVVGTMQALGSLTFLGDVCYRFCCQTNVSRDITKLTGGEVKRQRKLSYFSQSFS